MRPTFKQDIALQYFPNVSSHSAINRLSGWIKGCPQLLEALHKTGYRSTQKLLTGPQVSLIYEYLGEP